jgi:hypothetical protein
VYKGGINDLGVEVEAALQGAKDGLQVRRTGPVAIFQAGTHDAEIRVGVVLIAKTANLNLHELGELLRQVFHMHAGAAVDVRRVFIGQKQGFHQKQSLQDVASGKALPIANHKT